MRKGIMILVVAAVVLTQGFNVVLAKDIKSVVEQVGAKYADFEKDIQDMSIVQQMEMMMPGMPGMQQEVKLFVKGQKLRVESEMKMPEGMPGTGTGMGSVKTLVVFDGKNAWMESPFTGRQTLPADQTGQYHSGIDWWKTIGENARIAGEEKVNGRNCYIIETKDNPHIQKIWVDKDKLIMVKAEMAGGMMMAHSDFRKIKGDWEIPYATDIYSEGELVSKAVVTNLEVNTGLSDSLFQ